MRVNATDKTGWRELESKIDNLQLRINTQGRRMAELGFTTRSDWLLAEAVYLSRLANQRLQLNAVSKILWRGGVDLLKTG